MLLFLNMIYSSIYAKLQNFKDFKLYLKQNDRKLISYLAKQFKIKENNPLQVSENSTLILALDQNNNLYTGQLALDIVTLWEKSLDQLIQKGTEFALTYKLNLPNKFKKSFDVNNPKLSLINNWPLYQNCTSYILYNYIPKSVDDVVKVIDFTEYSDPQDINYFLMKTEFTQQLLSIQQIFAPNKSWLQLQGSIPQNTILGLQNQLWEITKNQFDALFLQYKYLLQQIPIDSLFQTYIHEGNYIISTHVVFRNIQQLLHKLFCNTITLEDFESINSSIEPLTERFRIEEFYPFEPQVSECLKIGQTNISYKNEQFKLKIARNIFFRSLSYVIYSLHDLDQQDQLLLQIDKLRSEQLAIIQEQNLEQNDILQQTVYQDKLSIIFQPIFGQYVDKYYDLLIDQLQLSSQYSSIISTLSSKISNFQRICPQLDKFILRQHSFKRGPDDERVNVPPFAFVKLVTQTPDKVNVFFQDIKNKSINTSIQNNIYNYDECAQFLGLFLIHGRRLQKNLESPEIKFVIDYIQPKLTKQKQKLLKFLVSPQSFNFFSVKEEVAKTRQIRPIEDIYAQEKSPIREIIQNMIIYLLGMNQNSVFFKIAEDYNLIKDYQAAGVTEQIGGVFHYDCLIKDYITGDSLHFSVKKLSVVAFRFFIIIYCSLIFISSLIFNNYKVHGEYCNIISNFSVLEQDRFIYLISQISNSLNVICNVKGFTESGAVGYVNSMYEIYFSQIQELDSAQELENKIMQCDFDGAILNVVQGFNKQIEEPTQQITNIDEKDQIEFQLNSEQIQRFESGLEENIQNLDQVVNLLKKRNQRENIFSGEKLFFLHKQEPKIDRFQLYSEKNPNITDFIRTHARGFQQLLILTYQTIQLRQELVNTHQNKLMSFECFSYECLLEHQDFIQFYNENSQYLHIRNECQVDSFLPITNQVALSQLIKIDQIEGNICILDEIIKNFCWMTQQIPNNSQLQPQNISLDYLSQLHDTIGQGFSEMITESQNLDIVNGILMKINRLNFSSEPLFCKPIQLYRGQSYYNILQNNSKYIDFIPDFKQSKEVFNSIIKFFNNQPQVELQELCENIVKMCLQGESINLSVNMNAYFKDIYSYEFEVIDNLQLGASLLIACYSIFDE